MRGTCRETGEAAFVGATKARTPSWTIKGRLRPGNGFARGARRRACSKCQSKMRRKAASGSCPTIGRSWACPEPYSPQPFLNVAALARLRPCWPATWRSRNHPAPSMMTPGRVLIHRMQSAVHRLDRRHVSEVKRMHCQNSLSRASMFAIRSSLCFEKAGGDAAHAGGDRCDRADASRRIRAPVQ